MELGALEPATLSPLEPWPEVGDPPKLLTEIADWLTGYGNLATRRTYAEGLGLPTSPTDLRDWVTDPHTPWTDAVARYAAAIRTPIDRTPPERTAAQRTDRTSSDRMPAQGTPAAPTSADRTPLQPTRPEPTSGPRDAAQRTPPGSMRPQRTQAELTSTELTPAQRAPAAPTPADRTPPEPTPTEPTPTQPIAAQPIAAQRTSADRISPDRIWPDHMPAHSTPVAPTPADRTSPEPTPAEPTPAESAPRRNPPPAPRGRLRALHWFRWCASHRVDPLAATSAHVKAWLGALADAGAAVATRDRMLATVKALYTHLADTGLAAGNPAALNRRRLGLVTPTGATTATVVLTTGQVRALFDTAATPRRGAGPLDTARARAVVALFTLGLRVSELCGLNRADLHVTRGRRALRVHGKGGKTRVVYLHAAAERAVTDYLHLRDSPATTFPARRGTPVDTPLLITRTGNRYQRQAVWQLLRRLATAAGDPLREVAGAMHPHALRHFYVTTAVEAGAQLVHVQADVGHTSIDTTEQVYNSAARDPSRSAVDLVGEVLSDRAAP